MYNPFELTKAVIRDTPHVQVIRQPTKNGQSCVFQKHFKDKGLDNAGYWLQRENDFLLDLRELQHTVNPTQLNFDQSSVTFVATADAGVTIQDWLQVQCSNQQSETPGNPFKHAGQFLQLIRACLKALEEIHRLGIVHCDIKPDNICLPYRPYPMKAGQRIHIDFEQIQLIDFAFSISRNRPLTKALPIKPSENYQSGWLKTALSHDHSLHNAGDFAAQKLDYRVDFFSLAYLAEKISNDGLRKPAGEHGLDVLTGAHRLVEQLYITASGEAQGNISQVHDSLIAEIDGLLAKATDLEKYRQFQLETNKTQSQADTPTPLASPSGSETVTPMPPVEDATAKPVEPKPNKTKAWRIVFGFALVGVIGAIAFAVMTGYIRLFNRPSPDATQQLILINEWLEQDSDPTKWLQAIAQLKPLAEGGDSAAVNLLASSYLTGRGVKIDETKACRLYKQALDAHNTDRKEIYDAICVKP
ncbi:MAG: hypothetical protein H8E62_11470 [Planctomycetes bacterium]|nr:hypothetical protein [Planctomycetota bacterium]